MWVYKIELFILLRLDYVTHKILTVFISVSLNSLMAYTQRPSRQPVTLTTTLISCHWPWINKKDGYRQPNVHQLGSLRPWDYRGKCYMDRKRIQCLSNTSQHVPIYLQPFLRYSGISVASDSGVETRGLGGSMNRGPELLGARVVGPQKILGKKIIGLLRKN